MSWRPNLGALPCSGGVHFRVWACRKRSVAVVLEDATGTRTIELVADGDGLFTCFAPGLVHGVRYRYRLDGHGPFPDPASRFQPEGVHGPSEVVDPAGFRWSDHDWRGVARTSLVIYELHVGTFTPEGTFEGVTRRLSGLAHLGITAIEIMPVADFPGRRNWGYDGVSLFAPARCYGRPDDLRRLVNEAHRLGLAVLLDVVYNHLGPDGNYLAQFSDDYFSTCHQTPWGPAVNLDGEHSHAVRTFLIENALHWLCEYHFDGLRLDATHSLFDDSPRTFLADLAANVREAIGDRRVHLIAEDARNLATIVRPQAAGGWGLGAVWSDDFHHELRRYLVGDSEGAFADYLGRLWDLVTTINDGWFFRGEYSIHRGRFRGTDPGGIEPERFVFYLQNHDRIGNRALGERLNHQVDPAAYRAASALLLTLPATPLLFMGQEWAASAPFLFFTDHHEALGRLVKEGRRQEFREYAAFADPILRESIPDCQAEATFLACKLDWAERDRAPHAGMLRLYRTLLRLRSTEPALRSSARPWHRAVAIDADSLMVQRIGEEESSLVVVVRFRGTGSVSLPHPPSAIPSRWELVMTTEDDAYAPEPLPPHVDLGGEAALIQFTGPAAVLLKSRPQPQLL